MTKHKRRQRTVRIYHGPPGRETSMYWTVKVSPAKHPVVLNGDVAHALKSTPGVTIGCGLSNVAIANKAAFPHECYLAAFVKTRAYIVDRLKEDGTPGHSQEYRHCYGHITDANDEGTLKKMVKENPGVMEREFRLDVLPKSSASTGKTKSASSSKKKSEPSDVKYNRDRIKLARGALRRAVKAGRIGAHVARQITDVAKRMAAPTPRQGALF